MDRDNYDNKIDRSLDDISKFLNEIDPDSKVYSNTINQLDKSIDEINKLNAEKYFESSDNSKEDVIEYTNKKIM